MAHPQTVTAIKKGVPHWNSWRGSIPYFHIDLSSVDLQGSLLNDVLFNKVDLRSSNLSKCYLRNACLVEAQLSHSNIRDSDLSGADLSGANLRGVDLRDVNLSRANLKKADLRDANLKGADLKSATLSQARLEGAILDEANLERVTALSTNFSRVSFTGACFKDWHINHKTQLDEAQAEYVYLEGTWNDTENIFTFSDRHPWSGSFQIGEFPKLFQNSIDTFSIFFPQDISWFVLFASLQDLRHQYDSLDIFIRSFEKKENGSCVVRLDVSEVSNREKLKESWDAIYDEHQLTSDNLRRGGEHIEQTAFLSKVVGGMNEQLTNIVNAQTVVINNVNNHFNNPYISNLANLVEDNAKQVANQHNRSEISNDTLTLVDIFSQLSSSSRRLKGNFMDVLEDIERDLNKSQVNEEELKNRFKNLLLTVLSQDHPKLSQDVADKLSELQKRIDPPP